MQLHKLERLQNTERCGQCYFVFSLRASSSGRYGDGERLQLRLWNLKSTSNSPVAPRRLSCQISANQREAETNANVNRHWKTRAYGNEVITNVISANQHFASTFSTQIFKFQRRCSSFSFLFPPRRQSLLAGYFVLSWLYYCTFPFRHTRILTLKKFMGTTNSTFP